jgi:hypothetical protein
MRKLIILSFLFLCGCKTARELGRVEAENANLKNQVVASVVYRDSVVRVPGETIIRTDTLPGRDKTIERHFYHTDTVKTFRDNPAVIAELLALRTDLDRSRATLDEKGKRVKELQWWNVRLWIAMAVLAFLSGILIALVIRSFFRL